MVPLPVSELEARFPLCEDLWLSTQGECKVTACDTTTMIRSGDPWAGLDDFHRTMLDYIAEVEEQQARTGWADFRRSLDHEKRTGGVSEIAAQGGGDRARDLAG